MSNEICLRINGTLYCAVILHYQRACPMRVTGSGFGDADAPVEEEIDFELFHHPGEQVQDEATIKEAERQLLTYYRSK